MTHSTFTAHAARWQKPRLGAALTVLIGLLGAGSAPAADTAQLERGRYLVEGIAACGTCHFRRDDKGAPMKEGGLAGGARWQLPTVTVYAANITPDRETGIGTWTDAQIANAIRNGVRPDGRALVLMPTRYYRDIADDDLAAIVAWLRAQPAQRNAVPAAEFRGEAPKPLPPVTEARTAPPRDDLVRWGAYLAGPLGHCMLCHTPRDGANQPLPDQIGAGGVRYPGPRGVAVSRNLTPDPSGLKDWTDAEIERAIRKGVRRDGSTLLPPMDFEAYDRIDGHDMRALIAYLRSLPPRPFGGSAALVER